MEAYQPQPPIEGSRASGFAAGPNAVEPGATWGSPRLVAKLVAQHSRYVWCLLKRLGVPTSQLDDTTQQVFIVAARRLEDLVEGRELAFLCGTAVRVAANTRRSLSNRQRQHTESMLDDLPSYAPSGEAALEQMQARRLLDLILDRLPEEQRTVFVLSEIEGMTAPEIAAIVGVPLGTVSSRLRRGREQFHTEAARLRRSYFAEGDPR